MDQVRVGVIGYGNMGTFHATYLDAGEVPGATLTAVCDKSPERLKIAGEKLSERVQYFASPGELFKSGAVDAVLIATPHYDHPPLGREALQHGLHILVEKPAGVYTKQVRELNNAASASDRVFSMMFNQRCRPVHQKMKDLVGSGELGEIRRSNWIITDWFRTQTYYNSGGWRATWGGEGGGVLLNQCPHNLDLWQWFCGMPKRIRAFCAFGKYHNIEVDDDVTAYAEYENGATGVFITTTGEAPGTNRLELVGDRGKAVLEGGNLTFWRTRQSVSRFLQESEQGFATPEVWKCEIPNGGPGEEHKGITKNWISAIRGGTPLLAAGQEGINSLQISNAMLLSAWSDAWVDIPVDEDIYWEKLQARIAASDGEKKKTVKTGVTDVAGTF